MRGVGRLRAMSVAALAVLAILPAAARANPIGGLLPTGPLNPKLLFSGYLWTPRNASSAMPGPNAWSSANALVDAQGALHLMLRKNVAGHWQSAEVQSDQAFGYGTYKWSITTPLNNLDPNVALGLFTNNEFADNHQPGELDVEVSRWTRWWEPKSAQFAVQPAQSKGHLYRTDMAGAPSEVHMSWYPDLVEFWVTSRGAIISDWSYYGSGIPSPQNHRVAMNLWQAMSQAPSDDNPVEIVITSFHYDPLS